MKYICTMKVFNKFEGKNARKSYISNVLADNTLQIDIFSNIDESWGYGVAALTNQLAEAKGQPLLVRVNSLGGSVIEGYAISNLLAGYKGDVTIQIVGYACSIASIFTTNQKKVQMAADAFFMIHNPSANWISGTSKEIESSLDALKMFEQKLIDSYVTAITKRGKNTATTEADIREAMNKETWYTAQEALEMGFVDEIIDGVDTLDNTLSSNIYGSYFYNSVTDFKNIPTELQIKFSNYNKQTDTEMVTKKTLANAFGDLAKKLGISADAANPDETDPPTPDVVEMTVESATAFLQKNGYSVAAEAEVVSEESIVAQVQPLIDKAVAAAKTQWVADAAKGKFTAPPTPNDPPKAAAESGKMSGFAAAIKGLKH